MGQYEHIADFFYCKQCIHRNIEEYEHPCDECLLHPVNEGTRKPVKFEQDPTLVKPVSRRNIGV